MRGLVNGLGGTVMKMDWQWPEHPQTPREIIADYFRCWGKELAYKTADDLVERLSAEKIMTLLTVVNDVCAAVGVHQTTAVIANAATDRTMAEMLALANEMADRIAADTREWTILRKARRRRRRRPILIPATASPKPSTCLPITGAC